MVMTESDVREIQRRLRPVIGQKSWGASLGIGSFITASFGKPVMKGARTRFAVGEWYLWIKYCSWSIEENGSLLADSEYVREELKPVVERINQRGLLSIQIVSTNLETTFVFERDLVLRLFPDLTDEDEYWEVFTPEGQVLVIGPGLTWSLVNASD